jgi:LDH2 family malate/lactate/ureidoglycolate dehydrogenase
MMERIDPLRLSAFGTAVLRALGVPEADATLVADSLVQADLWGHQSHGMMRLPWYVRRIQSGAMRALTKPTLQVDSGAVAVIDGHDGIGQVLAHRASREAIERAERHGVGAVAVRNSNHFGTAMYFSLMGPARGCVVLVATNASAAMAPWGGREKRVGTNPWSIAAPAGRYPPLALDIANTAVARGKIYLAQQRGQPIPAGWAINAAGEPTTDAAEAIAGVILPMAAHKGYGIAVMMDVLAGVLSGSSFGAEVGGPYQADRRSGCGHLMIALDIATFIPRAEFDQRMEQLIDRLKATPLAAGVHEVLVPGELEVRCAEDNRRRGLELPAQTRADLEALSKELGLAPAAWSDSLVL